MDILVSVINQKLRIDTNLKNIAAGSQNFVRFIFSFSQEWEGLDVFAQFNQNGQAYNVYLDNENSVYLPSAIKPGICQMMLYGTNGEVIGTSNYITLNIKDNFFLEDASSTYLLEGKLAGIKFVLRDDYEKTEHPEEVYRGCAVFLLEPEDGEII